MPRTLASPVTDNFLDAIERYHDLRGIPRLVAVVAGDEVLPDHIGRVQRARVLVAEDDHQAIVKLNWSPNIVALSDLVRHGLE